MAARRCRCPRGERKKDGWKMEISANLSANGDEWGGLCPKTSKSEIRPILFFSTLQFSEKSSRSLRTNSFEFSFSGDWILELLQNRFYFISFFIHHPFIFLIHRESKTFYISLEGDGSLFLSLVVFAILRIHFEYRNRISGVKDRPARLRTIK